MPEIIACILVIFLLCVIVKHITAFRSAMERRMHEIETRLIPPGKEPLPDKADADNPGLASGSEFQSFAPKLSAPPSPFHRPSITEILHAQDAEEKLPESYEEIVESMNELW